MVPRIAVLLSTYNGDAFLAEQLDSLLSQEAVQLELFVRDDGSTDNTKQILAEYASHWPQLETPLGRRRLGPCMSFLRLLSSCPAGFDYYAFCDQDDVWLPRKLIQAVASIAGNEGERPKFYHAGVFCVDDRLQPLRQRAIDPDTSLAHLLFEDIAAGHTIVMDARARALICAKLPAGGVIAHDWWCALVASAFCDVVQDPKPSALYRQHGSNFYGVASNRWVELAGHVRGILRDPRGFYPIHSQAMTFLQLFGGDMSVGDRRIVERLVESKRSLARRILYAFFGPIVRSTFVGNIAVRALILLGLY